MRPDILDALRYAYEDTKRTEELWPKVNPYISKGESMNNIKWRVTSINIDEQPHTVPEISVELEAQFCSGVVYRPITPDNIAKDIESRLNPPDKMYVCMARGNGKTVANVFNTLSEEQKTVVYKIIGEAISKNEDDLPKIKNVIFNEPATIVFWADNTKTVVKCQEGDEFDPEKGLTMAITKKIFGNKGNYCNEIKKWCEPYYEKMEMEQECDIGTPGLDALYEAAKKCLAGLNALKFSSLMAGADMDGDSEKDGQSYDPVQKAYDLLVDFHHNNKTTDLDEVIGYLGEALDK